MPTNDIFLLIDLSMKNIQTYLTAELSNSQEFNFDFDQIIVNRRCITRINSSPSGKPIFEERCFNEDSDNSSSPVIIGASLAIFTIILLIILLIKQNRISIGNFKSDFPNSMSSLTETNLLKNLKESYFPKLSIAQSFRKGNYLILKDLSGNIISESNLKGNYLIVSDLDGNVISEVKINK